MTGHWKQVSCEESEEIRKPLRALGGGTDPYGTVRTTTWGTEDGEALLSNQNVLGPDGEVTQCSHMAWVRDDLDSIAARYQRALDAKPSKGPFTEAGIDALCDSVGDIPTLLAALNTVHRVYELHPYEEDHYGPDYCGSCRTADGRPVSWPCPTIAALDGVE